MKLISHVLAALILFMSLAAGVSHAVPLTTHISEFSVCGAPGRDDLKVALQGVLASRLSPEYVLLVESKDKADLAVSGSYALFGKIFSLDIQINNRINRSLIRVYEQGEGEDDLLPAVGRLSRKVDRELAKLTSAKQSAITTNNQAPASENALKSKTADIIHPSTSSQSYQIVPGADAGIPPQNSYQIRSDKDAKTNSGSWTSPAINGAFSSVAMGRTLASGESEIFISGERNIRYYLKGAELRMVAEVTIPNPAKILSIDTADLDNDGIPELYVTIYDRETLTSQVYVPKSNGLERIVENLPWFYRGIGHSFKTRIIYAQEMMSGGDLAVDIAELIKTGKSFSLKNTFKLPASGYAYNFNRLGGTIGKSNYVVLNEYGYLVVSTPTREEVWKSSIKYGGSENNYKVELPDQRSTRDDQFLWKFLEQRIVITPDGTLLVPHNEGLFNIGNSRSYTKYSMHALHWNGSSLQEKWHTQTNQGYLSDFAYDAEKKELILLEVVQKSDIFSSGRSVISVNKID